MKIPLTTILAGMLIAGTACNRSKPAGHSHGGGEDHPHEHEEKTAQISIWTDRYEVFAEHKPPVAGKPVTFITHITDLQSLEPRREGEVKFHLRPQSGESIEHLQAAPARAGIYLPALTFPKAGPWQLQIVVEDQRIDLGTIAVYATEHDAAHAEIPEAPEGVSFLKEQQWKILTRIEPVKKRSLSEQLTLSATVSAKPGSMAAVVAPVNGRLVLPGDKPLPVPGKKVEAGELLILLHPTFSEQTARLLEAEAEAIKSKAAFEQAKLSYERVKRLAAADAKSSRELEESEFAFKNAQAQLEASTALQSTYKRLSPNLEPGKKLNLSSIELRAPIAGVISHVGSNLGEPVNTERVLFTILNSEKVWLEARVPEARINRIPAKATASFQIRQAGTNQTQVAEFVFQGMQIDPATRTLPIAFEADNKDGNLRLGQTLPLFVQVGQVPDALAIPEEAIVEEEGRPVAFVQLSGETFEKRDLTLGIRGGGWVQVLEGLKENDRVVTKGAYAIRLASVSSVIPAHGHAH